MNTQPSSFGSGRLVKALERLPACRHYMVGFSGGADSTALLFALSKIAPDMGIEVSALHFNHGLDQHSDQWADHCAQLCERLGVALRTQALEIRGNSGQGLEAEARRLRYEYAGGLLDEGEGYVTAHHLEDQAETVLLNLMRASGVDGLAGIPVFRPLGRGLVLRPLLETPMTALREYLDKHEIPWLEDPSNQDLGFDRNYVRHEVMPLLETRWPNAALRLARSADYCRQASSMLEHTCHDHLKQQGEQGPVIPVSLLQPESEWFLLMLRTWLNSQSTAPLPAAKAIEFKRQLLESAPDKCPTILWDDYRLSLFDGKLWLQHFERPAPCPTLRWRTPGPLQIGRDIGELVFTNTTEIPPGELSVGARCRGDRIEHFSGNGHRTVKNILREAGIPPWLRDCVPLLRRGQELLAVAGFGVSTGLEAWLRQHNSKLEWRPRHPVLQAACTHRAVDHDRGLR